MIRITELRLPLDHAQSALRAAILARLQVADVALQHFTVFRRAWDARKKTAVVLTYTVDCEVKDEAAVLARLAGDRHVRLSPDTRYRFAGAGQTAGDLASGRTSDLPGDLRSELSGDRPGGLPADFRASERPRPVVIGFGPCGIFAALILAQLGLRPIVLERGKAVRERTKDTWGLWRQGVLDPGSNVQFGEGGAGTFSDGKLYSQISDPRHLTRKVLDEFVKAGAPEEILYVSKPHIGTFRLVGIVEKMRASIIALGGEVRFQQEVTDVLVEDDAVQAHTGHASP
ncbi:MAG TPA: hypothetical protein VEZ89_17655, partial [Rubrivivax sp.]|nr:hypothetical protein [Rubrivivax sp.]